MRPLLISLSWDRLPQHHSLLSSKLIQERDLKKWQCLRKNCYHLLRQQREGKSSLIERDWWVLVRKPSQFPLDLLRRTWWSARKVKNLIKLSSKKSIPSLKKRLSQADVVQPRNPSEMPVHHPNLSLISALRIKEPLQSLSNHYWELIWETISSSRHQVLGKWLSRLQRRESYKRSSNMGNSRQDALTKPFSLRY